MFIAPIRDLSYENLDRNFHEIKFLVRSQQRSNLYFVLTSFTSPKVNAVVELLSSVRSEAFHIPHRQYIIVGATMPYPMRSLNE
jgi:hypothetical protein